MRKEDKEGGRGILPGYRGQVGGRERRGRRSGRKVQ
jgi:hypothetical protein